MVNTQVANTSCPAPRRSRWLAVAMLISAAGCAQLTGTSLPPHTSAAAVVATPAAAPPVPNSTHSAKATVRGQNAWDPRDTAPGNDNHTRYPLPASDAAEDPPRTASQPRSPHVVYQPPSSPPTGTGGEFLPPSGGLASTPASTVDSGQWLTSPYLNSTTPAYEPLSPQLPGTPVPLDVMVEEARTGRFMFGAGINSDAGVTGQITIDERNFDIFGFPRSFSDIWNGEAFRGRGQGFRLEAVPGNRVQRYLVSFTEPYLFSTPVSLNASGFLYDRGYFDWNESRVGGRLGLGYRLTPDLSASAALRLENVDISRPRVLGVPQLDAVLGDNDFYSARFSLRHDTRDLPFLPTEGHLIELAYEQAFGQFDYPRGEVEYRKYFLMRERPDGSGRHTLSAGLGAGFSGTQTPLFENYFAGGFSTLRGFAFRGASPMFNGVTVGGQFRLLGSFEYMFPLTADDMIKAVGFVDYGTVEEDIALRGENFRVAPGFGFRINVPALGPAPLAFDFAFPVAKADTDDTQVFSFFFGFGRG